MKKKDIVLVAGLLLCAIQVTPLMAQQAAPPPKYGLAINGEQAARVMEAAEAEARANGWNLSFAIVDWSGNLVMFKRMSDVAPFTADVAIKKAKTAAAIRAPSKNVADNAAKGGTPTWMVTGLAPMEGAVPIIEGGRVIGAIGASGAASSQDAQAAAKGAAVLN